MASIFLDIAGNALVGQSLVPAAITTTGAGTYVDCLDSNANMASALMQVGAVSGTQGTFDVKMQESTATNTGYTDIPGATFTQFTTTGTTTTGAVQMVSFQRLKRYVRGYVTVGGTVTSGIIGLSVFAQRATTPNNEGGFQNEQGAS